MKFFKQIALLIFLSASCASFLMAILALNSEGTTWGMGPALYGLILLFPSIYFTLKLSKFSTLSVFRWVILTTAAVAILFTVYTYFDAQQKWAQSTEVSSYYPPLLMNQAIGLFVAFWLLFRFWSNGRTLASSTCEES